jgi:hypothetical protein
VVTYVRKFVRVFPPGLSTPSKFRLNLWTSLATSRRQVFTPAATVLAQKNNVRLIDGNDLARLEKVMQASGDEPSG